MRADRLLSVLLLLQVYRRLTSRELAERLEVSERTIHRDMEALATAGVPVYAQRGTGGGWMLPDDYRTRVTGLSEAEVQALFAGWPERLLRDLGLAEAGEGAALKLLAAIPAQARSSAERMLERIHVDAPSWRKAQEPAPMLPLVQQALWADRCIRMTYRRADGAASERVVGPLGLVAKGNLWYLVATSGSDLRTFRASRIDTVEILDEEVERPEGFHLPEWWAASSADFLSSLPRYSVAVRAAPEIMPQIHRPGGYSEVEYVEEPAEGGWVRLNLHFETEDDACGYVLAFGPLVEILAPVEFRERVLRLAKAVIKFYEGDS